jgi:hypothetical protein
VRERRFAQVPRCAARRLATSSEAKAVVTQYHKYLSETRSSNP